jgi:glycosyltransferase involved in cell wall biosynthesis
VKTAILSPTTWQFVEKMASLFPNGVEVVGPLSDDRHYWNDYRRKLNEWKELNLNVTLDLSPYEEVDFSRYDLLIESVETFAYCKDWKKHCDRLECPVLVKACWTKDPFKLIPSHYFKKVRNFPVLLEMPAHAESWKAAGFTDVNVIFNPTGDWWFAKEWTGEKDRILFLLSGTKSWRGDPRWFGLEIWDKLSKAFPGKTYHQDGHVAYKTSRELTELFAESRVYVNLDRPFGQGERPLTLAFTEALSAGLPVVARDLPGLSYKNFIDYNGSCTNDFEAMCSFIGCCMTDLDFARRCSQRSREIARKTFSLEVLRPRYWEIIERAQEVYNRVGL